MTDHGTNGDARALARRFEQLVELAPDGIIVHDGDVVVAANAAAMRLVGATERPELIGQPMSRLFASPHLKSLREALVGARVPTEPSAPIRDTLHRLDGSTVDVEVRTVLFVENDAPMVHLVIRDITERLAIRALDQQVAERLRAAQRLDAVGALAGGVAHEVNNMMQVVIGFASLLRESMPADDAHLSDVDEILTAATHTGTITRQLLEFSRHAPHRPVSVHVDTTLLALTPMLNRVVGVTRHLLLSLGTTPPLQLDAGQFEQVLVNLLMNARQATQDGGVITIATRRYEETGRDCAVNGEPIPAGAYVSVSVHDNGVGMDAETRARIFEPFFTTKPIGQGTGLGLSAVQGILSQHLGYITIDSAPGHGTKITTIWPADAAAVLIPDLPEDVVARAAARRPSKVIAKPLAGITVLIVDDEEVVRTVVRRMLERAGATVNVAEHGADAMAVIETRGLPSLVITDVVMPVMGGTELVQRLHTRWPALPVLVMSGYPAAHNETDHATSSMAIDLPKPFTMNELLARVGTEMRVVP